MNRIKEIFGIPKELHCKGDLGIEVEIEGANLPRAVKGWVRTQDGSLKGESAEYVLQKPLNKKEAFEALDLLAKAYQESGTRSPGSIRESVHIHVNVQDFTIHQLYNFITCYLILEEILISYCGQHREGNLFCLRASDAKFLLVALKALTRARNFRGFATDDLRYASMNLAAIPKYGSLEFRSMRGTTNFEEIKTWINLLLQVKEYALRFETPVHIIQTFSEAEYGRFVEGALGEYYHLFAKLPGLSEMAKRGMRNAQSIAYAVDWDTYARSFQHNIFLGLEGGGGVIAAPARVIGFVGEVDDDEDDF